MELIFKTNCENVDWGEVRTILKEVGMSYTNPEIHEESFINSYASIFVYEDSNLVGFGRIISDKVRQSALYDLAIKPQYQGMKIGSKLLRYLMSTSQKCNLILYASPGKEEFYLKNGFRKMKTGMIYFENKHRMNDSSFVELDE